MGLLIEKRAAAPPPPTGNHKNFARWVKTQLPAVIRYYPYNESAFARPLDEGPNAALTVADGNITGFTSNHGRLQPGTLLDQPVRTRAMRYGTGGDALVDGSAAGSHFFALNSQTNSRIDSRDVSFIWAGIQMMGAAGAGDGVQTPMKLNGTRCLFGTNAVSTTIGGNFYIAYTADGRVKFGTDVLGKTVEVQTAAGVVKPWVPIVLVVQYRHSDRLVEVWVGSPQTRTVTKVANAVIATGFTNSLNTISSGVGYDPSNKTGYARAIATVDDFVLCAGSGAFLTEAQITEGTRQAGYMEPLSHTPARAHQESWSRCSVPTSTPLDSTSAQIQSNLVSMATQVGISLSSNTEALFTISREDRYSDTIARGADYFNYTGESPKIYDKHWIWADFPLPPGIAGSPGSSDTHASVWCPETDEYWEGGGNFGKDAFARPMFGGSHGIGDKCMSINTGIEWRAISGACKAGGTYGIVTIPTVDEVYGGELPPTVSTPPDLIDGFDEFEPFEHVMAFATKYSRNAARVYPCFRGDGSGSTSVYYDKYGDRYMLPDDAATDAAIAAMPRPLGRKVARSMQRGRGGKGWMMLDLTGWGHIPQFQDSLVFIAEHGYDPYAAILQGQPGYTTLNGFPWSRVITIDYAAMDPTVATQPVPAAPSITFAERSADKVTLAWGSVHLVMTYRVYRKLDGVYTLIDTTSHPDFTLWWPTSSDVALAVSSVNGGGESAKTDVTP